MLYKLPNMFDSTLDEFVNFSDVNFIVSDLDGTLIDGSEPILKQIKQQIIFLKSQKVKITIATGRTYTGAKNLFEEIGMENEMPIALYNGAIIIDYGTDKIEQQSAIDYNAFCRLQSILNEISATAYFYSFELGEEIWNKNGTKIIEKVLGIGTPIRFLDVNGIEIEWIDGLYNCTPKILTVLVEKRYLNDNQIEKLILFLSSEAKLSYTDSGNGFIEIKNAETDKGNIYDILRKKYDVKKILAIGDNDNDKELFEKADISVAVANSSTLAITTAQYLCENECAKGFLGMLETVKNAKWYYREEI